MQSKLPIFSFIVTTFGVLFKKSSLISKSKRYLYFLRVLLITYHLLIIPSTWHVAGIQEHLDNYPLNENFHKIGLAVDHVPYCVPDRV